MDSILPGDMVIFKAAQMTPNTAIVTHITRKTHLIVLGCVHGEIRSFNVAPDRPNTRRVGTVVINSFIRKIEPSAEKHGYLAGSLVQELRILKL